MLKTFKIGAALVSLLASLATAAQTPAPPRVITSFDPDWRFFKGDAPGAEKPDFNDAPWQPVDVPHDWSIQGPFESSRSPPPPPPPPPPKRNPPQEKWSPQPPINLALPTLWIIGDSTVRNGRDTGTNGQWGWGNPIVHFFDLSKINVQNRALGGASSRSFRITKEWDDVLTHLKPGDSLLLQFGHNDAGPLDDPQRARGTLRGNGEETKEIDNPLTKKHETVHTYGWYLRQYVADAKAKGAKQVIICSPIPRNAWTAGKVNRNTTYAPVAAAAAKQAGALFLDLNELIARRYDAEGQENVTLTYFPEREVVHPDWAGAVLNAQCVVEGLKNPEGCDLAQYLRQPSPGELEKPPTGKAR